MFRNRIESRHVPDTYVFDPPRDTVQTAELGIERFRSWPKNRDAASSSIIIFTMILEVLHKCSAASSDEPGELIEVGLNQTSRRGNHT